MLLVISAHGCTGPRAAGNSQDAGDVQFPTDALPEEAYEPVSDGQVMEVVVSNVGAAIAIGAAPIKGSRKSVTADRIEYDLLEGTFAGGRFVIWEVGGSLQAELLIFGSGLPIVSGNRGPLCPSR